MVDEISLLKKKLAQSESQLNLGVDPNIRVLEVLKQLGITATANADGTLQMSDGRVLGSALATGNGETNNQASATSLGFRGEEYDQMMNGASTELQEVSHNDKNYSTQLNSTQLKATSNTTSMLAARVGLDGAAKNSQNEVEDEEG